MGITIDAMSKTDSFCYPDFYRPERACSLSNIKRDGPGWFFTIITGVGRHSEQVTKTDYDL